MSHFPFDVIQRYFEYLDLLGFVKHLSYEWFSRRPVSSNPPNHAAASILKDVLKSVNPFCPHIDQIIKDELLLKLDECDKKKVLEWDKVKNSDQLCI